MSRGVVSNSRPRRDLHGPTLQPYLWEQRQMICGKSGACEMIVARSHNVTLCYRRWEEEETWMMLQPGRRWHRDFSCRTEFPHDRARGLDFGGPFRWVYLSCSSFFHGTMYKQYCVDTKGSAHFWHWSHLPGMPHSCSPAHITYHRATLGHFFETRRIISRWQSSEQAKRGRQSMHNLPYTTEHIVWYFFRILWSCAKYTLATWWPYVVYCVVADFPIVPLFEFVPQLSAFYVEIFQHIP